MSAIDWAIIAAYFALSLGIGLFYYRRAGESTGEYFVAGRSLPWWLAGTKPSFATFWPTCGWLSSLVCHAGSSSISPTPSSSS